MSLQPWSRPVLSAHLCLLIAMSALPVACGDDKDSSDRRGSLSCDNLSAASLKHMRERGALETYDSGKIAHECIWGDLKAAANSVSVFTHDSPEEAQSNKLLGTAYKPVDGIPKVDEAHYMGKFLRDDCSVKLVRENVIVDIQYSPKPYDEAACKRIVVGIASDYAQRNF